MSLAPPVAWTNPRNITRATGRISAVCENGDEKIKLPLSYVAALIDSSLLPVSVRDELTDQIINHLQKHDPEDSLDCKRVDKYGGQ